MQLFGNFFCFYASIYCWISLSRYLFIRIKSLSSLTDINEHCNHQQQQMYWRRCCAHPHLSLDAINDSVSLTAVARCYETSPLDAVAAGATRRPAAAVSTKHCWQGQAVTCHSRVMSLSSVVPFICRLVSVIELKQCVGLSLCFPKHVTYSDYLSDKIYMTAMTLISIDDFRRQWLPWQHIPMMQLSAHAQIA